MKPSEGGREPRQGIPQSIERSLRARIDNAVTRARLALFWEALWPRLMPLLVLIAVFLSLSWLGAWRIVPDWARFAALAAFGLAGLYFCFRLVKATFPGRAEALARVERASGSSHRPTTAYSDRLVSAPDDPAALALWTAHRQRLPGALTRLRSGIPEPRLASRDPFALRFLVALVLIVAFIVGGPERTQRVAEAFRTGETVEATLARIDAWVTPPPYTTRPPIFLTGEAARAPGTVLSVPEGSIVTVRAGGAQDIDVIGSGPEGDVAAELVSEGAARARSTDAASPTEHRLTLSGETEIIVRRDEQPVASWNFRVERDAPPEIEFMRPPAANASGSLSLAYTLKDDYGIVGARAVFLPARPAGSEAEMRPLYPAPDFPLSLPQLRARSGQSETIRDLTSHPWAGADVIVTLIASDDAGQEGRSAEMEFTLPARRFTNPLARAVVEQRTRLALDAGAAGPVADALDALTFAPERSIDNVTHYLALRSAYRRLLQARDDDGLREVVDYLWSIALGIEDGNLSLSAQTLRDAQEALRQALENDASDEEIARLTEQLREAMQQFLQAMAEEARRNPQIGQMPPNADVRTLRSGDLERMLDRIEDLARSGARDAARQLLSELQSMLDNLQAGRPMMADPQSDQMMQGLDQLGNMIREQQRLMDETHRLERGMGPDGSQSEMTPEQLEQALRDLQQAQQGLQQSLEELMEQLGQMGMGQDSEFGQAGRAMGQASESLGQGRPGSAVGNQGEALQALREGAQGLARQLAEQGQGQGQGQGPGGVRAGQNYPNEDPLGRPQRTTGPDFGSQVKVPDEIDTQRAREILDSIRRRLSEPSRPQIERDYLERLLDRF